MFYKCFKSIQFPGVFKKSTISPHRETGDKTYLNNSRPITLTNVNRNLFENALKIIDHSF